MPPGAAIEAAQAPACFLDARARKEERAGVPRWRRASASPKRRLVHTRTRRHEEVGWRASEGASSSCLRAFVRNPLFFRIRHYASSLTTRATGTLPLTIQTISVGWFVAFLTLWGTGTGRRGCTRLSPFAPLVLCLAKGPGRRGRRGDARDPSGRLPQWHRQPRQGRSDEAASISPSRRPGNGRRHRREGIKKSPLARRHQQRGKRAFASLSPAGRPLAQHQGRAGAPRIGEPDRSQRRLA